MKKHTRSILHYGFIFMFILLCSMILQINANAGDKWTRVDDNDLLNITYTGDWNIVQEGGLHQGMSHQTNETGPTASFTFEGTGVQWIGQKDTNYTRAKVYLDDRLLGLPTANGSGKQQIIYSLVGIPMGEHVLKIESLGPPIAYDANFIEIDAFEYTSSEELVNSADQLELTLLEDTIVAGGTGQAVIRLYNNNDDANSIFYDTSDVKFIVEDEEILKVDETGVITALQEGSSSVTAIVGEMSDTVQITVSGNSGGQKPTELRKIVNNENPALLVPLYGKSPESLVMENGDTLLGRWETLPDDIKPYAVMQLHPGGISGTNNIKKFYENQLNIAKEHHIPVALVVITGADGKGLDSGWAEKMLQTYDNLVAFVTTENYYSWDWLIPKVTSYLNVAAKYGAYVMCFEQWENTFIKLAENSAFMEAAEQYKDNLVLSFKTTSSLQTVQSNSYIQGMWLADICGQWGGLIDSWFWNERAYWKLFSAPIGEWSSWGDVVSFYGGEEARTAVSEPEAMIGIQMMNIYLNGGSVYNFEHPNYINGLKDMTTPLFDKIIVPVFRHIVEKPAPSKDEIQNEIKVVYSGKVSEADGLYTGLISEDLRSPLYTSGRYGIIPALPDVISEEVIHTLMPDAAILTKDSPELVNKEAKINFFNQQYPEKYEGEGYAINRNNNWYFYNSHDNQNINETMSLQYDNNFTAKLTIEPHTFGMLSADENFLNIHINNFRVNKDKIWEGYAQVDNPDGSTSVIKPDDQWNDDNPQMNIWLENTYMKTIPSDLEMRITKIELEGLAGEPEVWVTEGIEFMTEGEPQVVFDSNTGNAFITIKCNGEVNIEVRTLSLDTNKIEELLNLASQVEKDIKAGKYMSIGQIDFQKSLEKARTLMQKPLILQEEVNSAAEDLQGTINGLRMKPSVSDLQIANIADHTYCGSAILTPVQIKDGGYTLRKDTDYQVAYRNNLNAGTAVVIITGIGDYCGKVEKKFRILSDSVLKCTISAISSQSYNGSPIIPNIIIKMDKTTLVKDRDYSLEYVNNSSVGTASVIITGTGNYTGSISKNFKIIRGSVEKATISRISNQIYNGKAKKPKVTVRMVSHKLQLNRDYKVSYKKNKNCGKSSICIKGIGNYTGKKTVYFYIVPKKTSIRGIQSDKSGQIKLFWKQNVQASGYQITYAKNKSFTKKRKVIYAKKSKTTERKISGLTKGGKYYVKIRSYILVNHKKVYGANSPTVTVRTKR